MASSDRPVAQAGQADALVSFPRPGLGGWMTFWRWTWARQVGLWALLMLLVAGLAVWHHFRPGQPTAKQGTQAEKLESGLKYERLVRKEPRQMVIHILWIDLNDKTLKLRSTRPKWPKAENRQAFAAQTGTEYVKAEGLQAAINGDYFAPCEGKLPWNYYPKSGDSVRIDGPVVDGSVQYVPKKLGYFARRGAIFWRDDQGGIHFGHLPFTSMQGYKPVPKDYDGPKPAVAIGGGPILLRAGEILKFEDAGPHPQSAVAYQKKTNRLAFIAVDGRQPTYSLGMTHKELAQFLKDQGFSDALRLDGGGSTTLAGRDKQGNVTLMNRPVHVGIPTWQRPVANFLGVQRIKPSDD